MTSKNQGKECFVYITLPSETEPVTAARYELSLSRTGAVGRLVYGRSYLARTNAVEIDPVELKLGSKIYETGLFNGVFSSLRDASPDYWGRLVIQRALQKAEPNEMDYLLQSADDRAGALGFGLSSQPPAPKRQFNKTLELKNLQEIALDILKDSKQVKGPEAGQVERLLLLGTSMGGARPKAVVEDRSGLWLSKFNKPDDPWNNARVEHFMLQLARMCGIQAAESKVTKVAEKDILLVKRFDREKFDAKGYLKSRMVSGLTLLRADENERDAWSYPALSETIRKTCSNPKHNSLELFKRMCFNAMTSNTDDHPRNHAIIAKATDWHLSPAYDLTPSRLVSIDSRDLAMTIGDYGRYANRQNLLSQCGRFLLKREEAEKVIDEMAAIIEASWYNLARKNNVTVRDCKAISGAFLYPGFHYQKQAA